jgi:hypothetical protein
MRLASGLVVLFALFGCADSSSPEWLASRFVDAYYVRFDFERALPYASGGAARRIRADRERAKVVREGTQLESSKSRVYYGKPLRRDASQQEVQFTYELEVHSGSHRFDQEVVVMLAKRDGVWKVTRFFEKRVEASGLPAPGKEGHERVRNSTAAAQLETPTKATP